jgi:hypothetical protein
MKTKHIFWGLLFVSIGILILLNNLGVLYVDLGNIWKFWPLVIILWGVSYFTRNIIVKGFIAGISAVILAITLFAFFNSSYNFINNAVTVRDDDFNFSIDENTDTSNYNEAYDSKIKSAELNLNAGAGTFIINDSTDDLMNTITKGIKNNYDVTRQDAGDKSTITMHMKKRHFEFGDNQHNKNKTLIKLNTAPVWDMNFEVGAAAIDFDFSPFKMENIEIHMGAASLKTKIGNKSDITRFHLKAGVSSVDIEVPESSGCEIQCKTALSSKDFDDFTKINSNLYRSHNFDSAKKKVYLDIETGISSIHVSRYNLD